MTREQVTRHKMTMGDLHGAKTVSPLTFRHFTSIWIWDGLTGIESAENTVWTQWSRKNFIQNIKFGLELVLAKITNNKVKVWLQVWMNVWTSRRCLLCHLLLTLLFCVFSMSITLILYAQLVQALMPCNLCIFF